MKENKIVNKGSFILTIAMIGILSLTIAFFLIHGMVQAKTIDTALEKTIQSRHHAKKEHGIIKEVKVNNDKPLIILTNGKTLKIANFNNTPVTFFEKPSNIQVKDLEKGQTIGYCTFTAYAPSKEKHSKVLGDSFNVKENGKVTEIVEVTK